MLFGNSRTTLINLRSLDINIYNFFNKSCTILPKRVSKEEKLYFYFNSISSWSKHIFIFNLSMYSKFMIIPNAVTICCRNSHVRKNCYKLDRGCKKLINLWKLLSRSLLLWVNFPTSMKMQIPTINFNFRIIFHALSLKFTPQRS